MKQKQIINTIKEFVSITNFKGGIENGFLDSCDVCELTDYFPNTKNNKIALVENYLLWYYGSNVNENYCNQLIYQYKQGKFKWLTKA